MTDYLRQNGSSDRSLKRQIEGELAWQRYLRRKVEPFVNIGDQEVKGILDRLEAAKGTEEYNLREIFLAANDANAAQIAERAKGIIGEIQKAQQPFDFFAANIRRPRPARSAAIWAGCAPPCCPPNWRAPLS